MYISKWANMYLCTGLRIFIFLGIYESVYMCEWISQYAYAGMDL